MDLETRLMALRLCGPHVANEQPQKRADLDRENRRPPDHHVEENEDAEREGTTLLRRSLAGGIEADEQPEGQKPEQGAGIDDIDIAAVGKACDVANIESEQLNEIKAKEAFHGQHDAAVEGIAAGIRAQQINQRSSADDHRHDERPDTVARLRKQEIADKADERKRQHAARIIRQQDEGDRREHEHPVEAFDLTEPAHEIDAQHTGKIGERHLFEKQRGGAMVAEPEGKPPGDVDRILENFRAPKGDLLEAARVGEIESRIEDILIDAGEEDLHQENRQDEDAADPEDEGQAPLIGHHPELTEDTDDQDIAEEVHEGHAIGDRGVEHNQRKEANERDDRQRLLRKSAIEQVKQ